ncbi:F-box protein [Capsicum annuum]|nr:F-box protein [Capsicum annuum]
MAEEAAAEVIWNKETVPKVMKIVSSTLPQRDLITLLLVSPSIHRTLLSHPSLWLVYAGLKGMRCGTVLKLADQLLQVLDFHEMSNAGDRLVSALSLPRYHSVKHINLEFAQDIEDKQLENVKSKCEDSLLDLEILNLNGCQRISDKGIEVVTNTCPKLKVFSIYWNVRVTDVGITHLVKNCKSVVDLNLSGCKVFQPTNLLGSSMARAHKLLYRGTSSGLPEFGVLDDDSGQRF